MSSRTASRSGPWWAPFVAVTVTLVLAGIARLLLRRGTPGTVGDGGAYAPEPLTGDPMSVDAADVAPV